MIYYGCSQPRELWFNRVHVLHVYVYRESHMQRHIYHMTLHENIFMVGPGQQLFQVC